MKKKVLIIRSVSFQQLDKNLDIISKQFTDIDNQSEFHLLTHSHGIPRARSYKMISELIDYGSRKNFTIFHLPDFLKKKNENKIYDTIIVPVTNKSGAGFSNVLFMCLRIPSQRIYICNLLSEVWEITKRKIVLKLIKSVFLAILSVILIIPFIALFLVIFPLWRICKIKKRAR